MDDRRRVALLRGYERPIPASPRGIPASSDTQSGLRYEDATAAREPNGKRKKVSPKNRARATATVSATEKVS